MNWESAKEWMRHDCSLWRYLPLCLCRFYLGVYGFGMKWATCISLPVPEALPEWTASMFTVSLACYPTGTLYPVRLVGGLSTLELWVCIPYPTVGLHQNRPSPKELWGRSPNEAAVKVSR